MLSSLAGAVCLTSVLDNDDLTASCSSFAEGAFGAVATAVATGSGNVPAGVTAL
jgi:hypothetical protein